LGQYINCAVTGTWLPLLITYLFSWWQSAHLFQLGRHSQ